MRKSELKNLIKESIEEVLLNEDLKKDDNEIIKTTKNVVEKTISDFNSLLMVLYANKATSQISDTCFNEIQRLYDECREFRKKIYDDFR